MLATQSSLVLTKWKNGEHAKFTHNANGKFIGVYDAGNDSYNILKMLVLFGRKFKA